MSITCNDLSRLSPEEKDLYVKIIQSVTNWDWDTRKMLNEVISKEWYNDLEDFLSNISNKINNKELLDFNNYIAEWYEISRLANAHTFAYINKWYTSESYKNTINLLDDILTSKDKTLRKTKILKTLKTIKDFHNEIELTDSEIKDLTKEQTIWYYWDEGLIKILTDVKDWKLWINALKAYRRNLLNKTYITEAEWKMSWFYWLELNHQIKKRIWELWWDNIFMHKWTADRNISRIQNGKWEYIRYNNLKTLYSQSYWKYNDIIKQIYNKWLDTPNYLEEKANEIVDTLKSKWVNVEVNSILDNWNIIIKDRDNWNIMLLEKWVYTTDMDNIIHYFTDATDWWESTMTNISKWAEDTINESWNTKDIEQEFIDNAIKAIQKSPEEIKNMTKQEAKEYQDLIENAKQLLYWQTIENSVKLSELNMWLWKEFWADYIKNSDLMAVYNSAYNSWVVQLLQNLDLVKEMSPHLYNVIKSMMWYAETTVKYLQNKLLEKAVKFREENKVEEHMWKELLYSALDILDRKWLLYKKWEFTELKQEVEYLFDRLQNSNKSDAEIKSKLINYILTRSNYKNLSEEQVLSNITKQFDRNIEAFKDSRVNKDSWWYVAYLEWKYGKWATWQLWDKDILDLSKIIKWYYNEIGKHIKWIDYAYFYNEFYHQLMNTANTEKNLVNVFVNCRNSLKMQDKAIYAGLNKIEDIDKSASWFKQELSIPLKNKKDVNRIMEDFYWKSLVWENSFVKTMYKIRSWMIKLMMSSVWWKWLVLASQNAYTWISGGLTLYKKADKELNWLFTEITNKLNDMTKWYNENRLQELENKWFSRTEKETEELAKLKSIKEIKDVVDSVINVREYDPLETQLSKYTDEKNRSTFSNIIDRLNIEFNKLTWTKDVLRTAKDILVTPSWAVDDMIFKTFIEDRALTKILNEKWISKEELKHILNNLDNPEIRNNFITMLRDIKAEAVADYNAFFKTWYHTWLNRNVFSRWWVLNFFSSWGSKMFADNFYHMVAKPYRNFQLTYKLTGSIKNAIDSYVTTIISSDRFQAFIKQLVLWAQLAYESHKDKNIDWDAKSQIINTTLAFQWIMSFVMTRALVNWASTAAHISDNEKWTNMQKATYAWLSVATSILRNFSRETQMVWKLPLALLEMANKWELNSDSFQYALKSWLLNTLNGSLTYNIKDLVDWQYVQRFDDKSEYWALESIWWFDITKWSELKDKMKDEVWFEKFLSNPASAIKDKLSITALWSAYAITNWWKKTKELEILKKDKNLLNIQNNAVMPSDYYTNPAYVKSLKSIISESSLTKGWDLTNTNSIDKAKLELVFQDLKDKWLNPNKVISLIQSGIIHWKQADIAKITTMLNSKAGAATLLAYSASQIIKNKEHLLKQIYWKNVPADIISQYDWEVIKNVLPTLARLDRNLHAKLLWLYMKNTYMQKWSDMAKIFGTKVSPELRAKLFAQVVDLDDTKWNNDKIASYPTTILKWVKDEYKADMIWKVFDWIDESWVSYNTNIAAKASVLYNNYKHIKELLQKDPDKYQWAIKKLTDMIWHTDDAITRDPSVLEWMLWSWRGRRVRMKTTKSWVKIKLNTSKLPQKVKNTVRALKKWTLRIPAVKLEIQKLLNTKMNLRYKPFNFKPYIYEPNITPIRTRSINPRSLNTRQLTTKSTYLKSHRVRKPKVSNVEKVLRKTKSNSKDRRAIKPSRINR